MPKACNSPLRPAGGSLSNQALQRTRWPAPLSCPVGRDGQRRRRAGRRQRLTRAKPSWCSSPRLRRRREDAGPLCRKRAAHAGRVCCPGDSVVECGLGCSASLIPPAQARHANRAGSGVHVRVPRSPLPPASGKQAGEVPCVWGLAEGCSYPPNQALQRTLASARAAELTR
jgi:hypothetical protein